MITRIWRGWTTPGNAEAYEALLRDSVLPGIVDRGIEGYRGAHLLARFDERSRHYETSIEPV